MKDRGDWGRAGGEKGWELRKREGREEMTGRGPQFEKTAPPPPLRDGWLLACNGLNRAAIGGGGLP